MRQTFYNTVDFSILIISTPRKLKSLILEFISNINLTTCLLIIVKRNASKIVSLNYHIIKLI